MFTIEIGIFCTLDNQCLATELENKFLIHQYCNEFLMQYRGSVTIQVSDKKNDTILKAREEALEAWRNRKTDFVPAT